MSDKLVRVRFEAVLNSFTSQMGKAKREVDGLGDSGDKASKKVNFKEPTESVNKFEGATQKAITALKTLATLYIGKKLIDSVRANTEAFMELENQMRAVHTLLPDMTEEMYGQMTEEVKQFAKEMKVLPEQVIPAVYQAISAGVPQDNIFTFLETSQKAARGGITDLETATKALTGAVNSYGPGVLDAAHASDLMFTTVKLGVTDFGQLADSLYNVLPSASAAKVSFEEISAAMATLTYQNMPTSVATTRLRSVIDELSKSGTKASDTFKQLAGQDFKAFQENGGDLQQALILMEEHAKSTGLGINDLFSSVEAGAAALGLTGPATEKFNDDMQAMREAAGATEAAFEKMDGTLSASIEGIKARFQVFAWDIAGKYSPEVKEAVDKISQTLERLDQDGSLDRLAQSIGGVIAAIIRAFDGFLNNIDGVIRAFDRAAYFIENHIDKIIFAVKLMVGAFLGVKVIMGTINTIMALRTAFDMLRNSTLLATAAQKALNTAMKVNPLLLVIGLVIALTYHIFTLRGELKDTADMGTYLAEELKLRFLQLFEAVWGVISMILELLREWLGWIPLIGDAIGSMADFAKKALGGLGQEIDTAKKKLSDLRVEAEKPIVMTIGVNYDIDTNLLNKYNDQTNRQAELFKRLQNGDESARDELRRLNDENTATLTEMANQQRGVSTSLTLPTIEPPQSSSTSYTNTYSSGGGAPSSSSSGSSSGGSSIASTPEKPDDPPTVDDRIRQTLEVHQHEVDLHDSRAQLADELKDDKGAKKHRQKVIDVLTTQARQLLGLKEQFTGADKNIVETARNKILSEIARLTGEINETLGDMIGSFNIPSELKEMTKYVYDSRNAENRLTKHYVVSPEITMYLTIEDLEGKGAQRIQEEVKRLAGATFNKDDLVDMFMLDVTRN